MPVLLLICLNNSYNNFTKRVQLQIAQKRKKEKEQEWLKAVKIFFSLVNTSQFIFFPSKSKTMEILSLIIPYIVEKKH